MPYDDLENPVITKTEMYGPPETVYICRWCRRETDGFAVRDGEIVGCRECVSFVDAWEMEEEQ